MKSSIHAVLFALILPALAAAQAAVDGGWSGEIRNDNTVQIVVLVLKSDEGRLSGSVVLDTRELAVEGGKVAGDRVEFKTTQRNGDTSRVMTWTGTIDGEQIVFSVAVDDGRSPAQRVVVDRQIN